MADNHTSVPREGSSKDVTNESRKGKKKWYNASLQHGSVRHGKKRRDMGRGEWSRQPFDRRAANDERNAKRQKLEEERGSEALASILPAPFSEAEIAAEERRPKHKVAVLIGYSGSGYRGMQINTTEKTIEGDLFTAFVKAGAIAKANANDPKKSALVRCARTDKGVHAAGNVVSLKLIIEDENIVAKINEALSPQIRVWGIHRTINSFSCYQACDSRWYEYLIPTHSFLPPHPDSNLAKKLLQFAEETGDLEAYKQRQEEVADFWTATDEKYITPIIDSLEETIRTVVWKDIHGGEEASAMLQVEDGEKDKLKAFGKPSDSQPSRSMGSPDEPQMKASLVPAVVIEGEDNDVDGANGGRNSTIEGELSQRQQQANRRKRIDAATRQIRGAYLSAKKAHRLPAARLARVDAALKLFLGTNKYHNYTVGKSFNDSSCKRVIKSFAAESTPHIIGGTEWLSIKVHGQSFMMHQIRKMIGMIALVVRCGCPLERITESFGDVNISIPKAPGLGLLLERPVFDSYNERTAPKFDREPIDFARYEREMTKFKQVEIYERIFREEEEGDQFHTFFAQVDAFTMSQFWYLSSLGIAAVKKGRHGHAQTQPNGCSAGDTSATTNSDIAAPLIDSEDDEDTRELGRNGGEDG